MIYGVSDTLKCFDTGKKSLERRSGPEYRNNPYTRTLNFEGQAAVGSSLMITNSNIRLLGS